MTQFDDRGRPVDILDWQELDVASAREAELRRLIESQLTDPTAHVRTLAPAAGGCLARLVVVFAASYAVFAGLSWIGVPTSAIWIPVALTIVLVPLVQIPSTRWIDLLVGRLAVRNQTDRLIAWSLSRSICPGCGYDLERLEVTAELDECIVCPECGAAWKAGRIGRPDPTRPEPFQPS